MLVSKFGWVHRLRASACSSIDEFVQQLVLEFVALTKQEPVQRTVATQSIDLPIVENGVGVEQEDTIGAAATADVAYPRRINVLGGPFREDGRERHGIRIVLCR